MYTQLRPGAAVLSLVISVHVLSATAVLGTIVIDRVNVDSAGNQATAGSDNGSVNAISGDGRYVAFVSAASNLVGADTFWIDVFVHDRLTGVTERVSVNSAGNQGNGDSTTAGNNTITPDGRFVVFQSKADNLVAGDTNEGIDVFIHDRVSRVTERVSVDSAGNEGNSSLTNAVFFLPLSVSADGRYVAFTSDASNLVAGDINAVTDVFVHDRVTGLTERVSVGDTGAEGDGRSITGGLTGFGGGGTALSADGRYAAFTSDATNLVADDTNGQSDVFVHDRLLDTTERVSVSSTGGEGNGPSYMGTISPNGAYVVFVSAASNLVAGDTNRIPDVFIHDRSTGVTERLSVDSVGNEANGESWYPVISGDSRFVAFMSEAANLVPGDTNGASDIFVRDRLTRTTVRASVDETGGEANGGSLTPAISADGRHIGFTSYATNLVPDDTNDRQDVFVTTECSRAICGDAILDFRCGEECDDGNTDDGDCCSSTCQIEPTGTACNDGNACTGADVCSAGECVAGPPLDCDDGNVCTTDSCDPVSGCVHTNNTAPCSDGNACTAGDTCSGGSCSVYAYRFSGFFPPVDNPGVPPYVVNRVKAGSAIPVKFSLSCDMGLHILQNNYPRSENVGCVNSSIMDDIEETVTAGGSSLTYDATTGQYTYVWKTDKAWAGTCRKLTVRFTDNTDHVAYFSFAK